MDPVFEIIKELPNKDLQVKRIAERKTYHCPSCGENVTGCYGVRTSPRKPVSQLGICIPCPSCGTFTIDVSVKNGKEAMKVKETGADYDLFARAREADTRMRELMKAADGKDDPALTLQLAEAAARFADELKIADPRNSDLWQPYRLAVDSYCKLIESGRTEYVEPLARLTLRCNSIAKYDLMATMNRAYILIHQNERKVPRALFRGLMIERALLRSSFDRMFLDDPDEFLEDSIRTEIEVFESLSAQDRAEFPYAASNGWNYILNSRRRRGAKNESTAARKVIAAIRDARKEGAPEDREQLMRMAICYRAIVSGKEKTYKDMISDAECWSDPLYLAIADYTFAEHIYCSMEEDLNFDPESVPPKALSEAVKRLNEAIGILETVDDLNGFTFILSNSYLYRGILTGDSADKKLACHYAMFFNMIGQGSRQDVLDTLMIASTTEELGSPLQIWAMRNLGMPV